MRAPQINSLLPFLTSGDLIAGKYRVERVLGSGGMGVVLAATHKELGRRVAVKLLRPHIAGQGQALDRFLREARAAARIESDHVVRVFDVGTLPGGHAYMVMEYLEGMDLGRLLALRGQLDIEEAVDAALETLDGLAHAHALGLVHRDLKPGNLFCAPGGRASRIKVLDFGLSKSISGLDLLGHDKSLTAPDSIIGSPAYMSPEQVRNSRCVDQRTDIWSMGVILFELITGELPFNGETVGEVFASIIESDPPAMRSVRADTPDGLDSVVRRCMERDREERYSNVAELSEALEPFASPRQKGAAAAIAEILERHSWVPVSSDTSRAIKTQVLPPAAVLLAEQPLSEVKARSADLPGNPPGGPLRRWARPARWAVPALGAGVLVWTLSDAMRNIHIHHHSSEVDRERLLSFEPLPAPPIASAGTAEAARVELGRRLFQDHRLSQDGALACSTCHPLDHHGADGKARSIGAGGQLTLRNAPSVFNITTYVAYHWDGSKESLVAQAEGVLLSPRTMGMSRERLESVLISEVTYDRMFREAFPGDAGPVTLANTALALAAYEETLSTPSRWDRFLAGDDEALTEREKIGFNTFIEVGCVACHVGPAVGGSMFHKIGVVKPWPDTSDLGRYEITRREADRMVFRVPSLRNAAVTGPYFHNGATRSLEDAIWMMGAYQIGQDLDEEDVSAIAEWIGCLTGEIRAAP